MSLFTTRFGLHEPPGFLTDAAPKLRAFVDGL
jgi:hypothetical protein